jgi:arylsulfatase A-like enzyme
VISTDFFPSIIEMTGIGGAESRELDGVSFARLLTGADELPRDSIYWHFPHYSNHGLQSPGGAIRRGDYKLLEYFEQGTAQLFNLRSDPGEQYDFAASEPERVAVLKAALHIWRGNVGAQKMQPNRDYLGERESSEPMGQTR